MSKKAICLFSGGLDSTTTLYAAREQGYEVYALTLIYGQIHAREIESAKRIAKTLGVHHEIIEFKMPWKGSALLDRAIPVPHSRKEAELSSSIPVTYVPARNTIFLSFAASFAEAIGAEGIFIGANALDYSGYPDCRPAYFEAAAEMLKQGTKAGVEGQAIKIHTPLLKMTKAEIILLANELKVPLNLTWSCYEGAQVPCGTCDSCQLRAKGFQEAGVKDPLIAYEISG